MVDNSLADPLCLLESGSRGSAGTVTSPGDRLRILSARPPTADGGRGYRHRDGGCRCGPFGAAAGRYLFG